MPPSAYPESLEIKPLDRPPCAIIRVPGSKSMTNRALVLTALASRGRDCMVGGALQSEDTEVMIACLRKLGFKLHCQWLPQFADSLIRIKCPVGVSLIPCKGAELFVENSGTTMRFLTAMVALGHGRFRLDGSARMRERPIEDLLDALRQLGVNAYSENRDGHPPVIVEADGIPGGIARLRGDVSSQFVSAMMMVAPFARAPVTLEIEGPLVSRPYAEMTRSMMELHCGVSPEIAPEWKWIHIPNGRYHRELGLRVEPDATAASCCYAAAAITGGRVTMPGLFKDGHQGDRVFPDLLARMGCQVVRDDIGTILEGGSLHAIDVDMNAISDSAMTLAVVACFADGPTTVRNIAHVRLKESDRIAAMATELRKVGARVEEKADGWTIHPAPLHGAAIETYNDHRIAMSMALIGLRIPGIIIRNPGCVAKTYPGFFDDLERLR